MENDGKVLGYRVMYNPCTLSDLATSFAQLPPLPVTVSEKGEFEESHYVVWADYAINSVPFVSLEFQRDEKKWGCKCMDQEK
jgi:hypothetical protein